MHNNTIARVLLKQSLLGLILLNNTVFGMKPTDNFEMITQELGSKTNFSTNFPNSSPTKKGLRADKRIKNLDKENINPNIIGPKPSNNTSKKRLLGKKLFAYTAAIGLSKNPATIPTEEDADAIMQIISEENIFSSEKKKKQEEVYDATSSTLSLSAPTEEDADTIMQIILEKSISTSEENKGENKDAYFLNLPPEMICKIAEEVSNNEGAEGLDILKLTCRTFYNAVKRNRVQQTAPFCYVSDEILSHIFGYALNQDNYTDGRSFKNIQNTCCRFKTFLEKATYEACKDSLYSLLKTTLPLGFNYKTIKTLIKLAKTPAGSKYFLDELQYLDNSNLRLLAIFKVSQIPLVIENSYLNNKPNKYESYLAPTKMGKRIAAQRYDPMSLEEQLNVCPEIVRSHLETLIKRDDLNSFVDYLKENREILSQCKVDNYLACKLLLNIMEQIKYQSKYTKEVISLLIKRGNLLNASLEEIKSSGDLSVGQQIFCDDTALIIAKAVQTLAQHVNQNKKELIKTVRDVRYELENTYDDLHDDDAPWIKSDALDSQLKLFEKLLRNRQEESEEEQLMNDTTVSDGGSSSSQEQ